MASEYVFPGSDLDRVQVLISLLGSYWFETYDGQKELEDFVVARAAVEQQTQLDLLEAVASVSRLTVPVLHRENWQLLTFRESDLTTSTVNVSKYGDYDKYGPTPVQNQYGVASTAYYRFALPGEIVDAGTITNRIHEPSMVLTKGIDFTLDLGSITFKDNPFANELLPTRPVFTDGVITDKEGFLWAFKAGLEWKHIYNHFGHIIGVELPSTETYRDLVNAIFDCLTVGSTKEHIEAAIRAMAGIPTVVEATETVEMLHTGHDGQRIVGTDKHVYKFGPGVNLNVGVGDVLHAGDSMVEEFEVIELNSGTTPNSLQALSMGEGFLSFGYFGDLQFNNETVDLVVDENHVSGKTYISFDLHGHPLDVQKFFDDVHTAGQERGLTLAEILDTRDSVVSEPTAASLPATINPLEFLISNVLRGNAFVVRVSTAAFGDGVSNLDYVRLLRKIVPPHTALILLIELPRQRDNVTMAGSGTLSTFTGAEPLRDVITAPADRVTIRSVGTSCE